MADDPSREPILTLEPLLDAIREGLEEAGWSLSGLQKTTSYEFEGRWAGDSSRSAYIFFHRPGVPDWISIDAFLDETSRGLKGNLALVLEGPPLRDLSDPAAALRSLATVARERLPEGYRAPLTLRYRLPGAKADPLEAATEIRFKLYLPPGAMASGAGAVSALAGAVAGAYLEILEAPELEPFLEEED